MSNVIDFSKKKTGANETKKDSYITKMMFPISKNLSDNDINIIKRMTPKEVQEILSHEFPGSVISERTILIDNGNIQYIRNVFRRSFVSLVLWWLLLHKFNKEFACQQALFYFYLSGWRLTKWFPRLAVYLATRIVHDAHREAMKMS